MKEYISNLIKSEITALDEKAKRDYKAEYKKFQSSTKAKKYRAELNKYNRQKGTYGNGDKKDASHKGGKIVGFESQSKNRGRAEKSRLKKEDLKRLVKTYVVERVLEACQKGYMTHPTRKTKIMFGKRYRNCVKKEDTLPSPSRKLVKKMKKKGNTSVPYGSGYKKVNETPYELGGMKVYSKADGLKKVKSMKKTAGAKIYKVTKTKTKLYGTNPVTMYNLYTKNKNHSTRQNPYGLDMMKGVYLIPIKESVNEQSWHKDFKGYSDKELKVISKFIMLNDKGIDGVIKMSKKKDFKPLIKKMAQKGLHEGVNEREMSIKDAYKDLVKDHGSKKALDMLADVLTGGALAAMDDKKVKAFKKKLLKKMMKESVNEYTYGVGDIVKDINPTCPHNGAVGKVKSVNPKSVVFVVMNKGKNYQPGDVLDKTHDQMKKMNEISNSEAKTLLKQLGGRRFMMMVGAKGIARDKDGLHMKIGRNSKSISHVVIDYNRGRDLYDMKFLRVRKSGSQMKVKTIKHVKGIYADQLHDTFEKHTGLYTRM